MLTNHGFTDSMKKNNLSIIRFINLPYVLLYEYYADLRF